MSSKEHFHRWMKGIIQLDEEWQYNNSGEKLTTLSHFP
jgi:hypothetical protein